LAAETKSLIFKKEHLTGEVVAQRGLTTVPYSTLLRHMGRDFIEATGEAAPGEEEEKFSTYTFGAVFAEVQVDPHFGTVRVPRIVGAYDVGRVVNPKIARSQCIGGIVGGLGMALLEQAEWDPRFGRVMNANFAEYLVPVNADVKDIDVLFVPGDDRSFNPLGVKGLAELALCGVAPAIAKRGLSRYRRTGPYAANHSGEIADLKLNYKEQIK
jgi:xanthine dehydrogenase YagR molybdenum-binding subunit